MKNTFNPFSLTAMAKHVAKQPPEDREQAAKVVERNVRWPWRKVLAEANRIAQEQDDRRLSKWLQ